MHIFRVLSFLATFAAAIPSEDGDPIRPPEGYQIAGFVNGGTGCPAGSVALKQSPDSSRFSLQFDALVAEAGRNISARNLRRNCQINMKIKYPSGWQFAVSTGDYRGYAQIPAGLTGVSRSTYYFSGQTAQVIGNLTITGPYDDLYHRVDQFDATAALWSRCGDEALLNVNTEVRLLPSNSTAMLTTDALENLALAWRRCDMPPPPPETSASASP